MSMFSIKCVTYSALIYYITSVILTEFLRILCEKDVKETTIYVYGAVYLLNLCNKVFINFLWWDRQRKL